MLHLYLIHFFKKNSLHNRVNVFQKQAFKTLLALLVFLFFPIHILVAQDDCNNIGVVPDIEICPGDTYDLDLTFPLWDQYTVDQSGTFNPLTGVGTTVILEEDEMSEALPIGFTFSFFGNDYTEFYISSNGFIAFDLVPDQIDGGCCAGQLVPDPILPNNLIAFAWEDLDPSVLTGGGTIQYYTTGTAPNQILVIDFIDVQHFDDDNPLTPANTNLVTSQVQLYETTNVVEMHTTSTDGTGDGGPHTMGIENSDGTVGITPPGRNQQPWSATNDFVSFIPNGFVPCEEAVVWTNDLDASELIGRTHTVAPDYTTTYTASIDCGIVCTHTVTVTVDATPPVAVCQNQTVKLDEQGLADVDLGTSLEFDGVDDYVEIPDVPNLQWAGSITVEAWIKPYGTTGAFNVVISKYLAGAHGFLLNVNSMDSTLRWIVGNDEMGTFEQLYSTNQVAMNQWNHVAAVYDGTELRLYLNGEPEGSVEYLGGMNTIQGQALTIGTTSFIPTSPAIHNFWGLIDEVRLWDVAKTQADIQAGMFQQLPDLPGPPRAYWGLNDGPGSFLTAGLTAATDGVLINMDNNEAWQDGVNPLDGGSTDDCKILEIYPDKDIFTCADLGDNVVVLTVEDTRNNTTTCTAMVTVLDPIVPNAVCQAITIELDQTGNVSIEGVDVDGGSSDNCPVTFSVLPNAFICDNLGLNQVRMSVVDEAGNENECSTIVTVQDNIIPTPKCIDITIEVDNTGNVAIVPSDVDNGSTDNCAFTLTVERNAFTCADLGDHVVTLTSVDQAGNEATCTAGVYVDDVIIPTAKCKDISIGLDNTGNVAIVPSDVDNGSTDNCTSSLSIHRDAFSCIDLGDNIVSMTIIDANDNLDICTSIVTVQDNILPTPKCQDIVIQLDDNGDASIVPSDVDNGSTDNCDFTLSVAPMPYTCANVGANVATLTAIDEDNNVNTCTATVTVEDNVAPIPLCKNITIEVDAQGEVSIIGGDVDDGSNDACGIANLEVSPNAFTCANLGDNSVVLTVTDVNTNTAQCNARVTVEDNIAPTLTCSVNLDECGIDGIVFYDDPIAEDNCSIVNTFNVPASGHLFSIGETTVTGYAVDVGGNTSTCTFSVTYLPPSITLTPSDYNGFNVSCSNGQDGTITATVTNGFPPFEYLWSDGQMTQTATGLSAGFYTLTVTDDNQCVAFKTISLTGATNLVCTADVTDISCFDSNDGEVTALPLGGVGNYAFNWTGPNGFSSNNANINGLQPGAYTVEISDDNNCQCSHTVTVEEPTPLEINTTDATVIPGQGASTPFKYNTYIVELCGGTLPYELDWETEGYVRYSNMVAAGGCMSLQVVFVNEASWSVTLTDLNGCTNEMTVLSPDEANLLQVIETNISPATNACTGGAIDLVVEGGTPPYNFEWKGPDSWTAPPVGPGGGSITGLPSGWYEVEVTDAANPMQTAYSWAWVSCGGRSKMSDANKGTLTIAPNPVIDNALISFSLPDSEIASLTMYDLSGREVQRIYEGSAEAGRLYQKTLHVQELPTGIYLVELQTPSGKIYYQKVVVHRP